MDRLSERLDREARGVGGTGTTGTGPVYKMLQGQVQFEEAELERLRRDRDQQLVKLRAEREALQGRQAREAERARARIGRSGLLLHIQALSALSLESGAVATTIWVVRVWIVLLDAMPVLVRLLQSVVGRRSYDQVLAALQHGEELEAERLREQAALRLQLARELAQRQAEAAQEKAEIEARLVRAYHEHRAEQQLAALWSTAESGAESGEGGPTARGSRRRGALDD